MNLYLIISGNLTGFSHFYASAGAKDFYEQSKIDFDFRNYLLFLKDRQKAYAVSFTDKTIAVSLVTRVLDSFRRPGVLNMTLLLPRKYKVSDKGGLQGGAALYQLLNEVNDMFYQRNFLNGMMNQNGAVLMQDYYSPILERYQLVPDPKQRDVNARINVALAKNNVGYIAAAESDISLYLETLCRESYEGYHHVFLASDAPQNINESPVEEVFYPVRYTSNMEAGVEYSLPKKVRMSDKIDLLPNLRGYVAFNQDYTYEQIFQGACKQITAQLRNEVIYLTYQFEEEHRKVTFEFQFGTSKIDMREIFPVKLWIGNQENYLQNNSLVFSGKEIYHPIRLVCENEKYEFVPGTAEFDLSRYPDEKFYVQVQSKTVRKPEQTELKLTLPKDGVFTIRIINKPTGRVESFNQVKGSWQKMVSGAISDWRYEILSDQYKTVSGDFSQAGGLTLEEKQGTQNQSKSQLSSQTKYPVQIKDSQGQSGAVSDGGERKQSERNKFIRANLVVFSFLSVAVLALLGLGGYIVYDKWKEKEQVNPKDVDNDCKIRLSPIIKQGTENKILSRQDLEKLGLMCKIAYDTRYFYMEEDNDSLTYILTPKSEVPDSIYNNSTVTLSLVYNKDTIFKYVKSYHCYKNPIDSFYLNIFNNLKSIKDSLDNGSKVNKEKVQKYLKSIEGNQIYGNQKDRVKWSATNLYIEIKQGIDKIQKNNLTTDHGGEDQNETIEEIKTELDKACVTLERLDKLSQKINSLDDSNSKTKTKLLNKVSVLKTVITNLRAKQKPNDQQTKYLSPDQVKALNFGFNPKNNKEQERIKQYWNTCNKNRINVSKIQSILDFSNEVKNFIEKGS
ncbi:hypothetical protein [Bacteroides sp. OF04-15BH]|uniref:hypothetical protein n=1 Tax=Bacteroides sp. OF04-15BH TaxID=2292281 RepID=UPI000E541A02|nr:hypothetical protein [Bacteroides sp. OF04-15BH]